MPSSEPHRRDVHAAWLVSLTAVVWTVTTSGLALALGASSHSAVLGAFGAIGLVDAAGSIALVYHFRHGLRHDALSDRLERLSHRVVVVGLLTVGLGAVGDGFARLLTGASGDSSRAGSILAAISLVVLVALASRKISVSARVGSAALLADGRLSAVGAAQAGVTLFGTAAARWLDWPWADALAATLVGIVAISVGVATRRRDPN